MSRVELTHRFATPLRDGFDYIVDARAGARGIVDRRLVRGAVARTLLRTVGNLEERLPAPKG